VVGVATGVDSEELKSEDRERAVVERGCRTRGLTVFFRIISGGGAGNREAKSPARGSESEDEVEERGLGDDASRLTVVILCADLEE